MKGLHFHVDGLADEVNRARFERAHIVGVDRMPWPSRVSVDNGVLTLSRNISESGSVHLPWNIDGIGDLLLHTTTLMERDDPYRIGVELARGALNQVRNQMADWELLGLKPPDGVATSLRKSIVELRNAIDADTTPQSEQHAQNSLQAALSCGESLTEAYYQSALAVRRKRTKETGGQLGCVFDDKMLDMANPALLANLFHHISIPLDWGSLEAKQGEFDWKRMDRRIEWCQNLGLPFTVGPLLDFRTGCVPAWLGRWRNDVQTMVTLMMDVIETCVVRYRDRVKSWDTTARTNSTSIHALNEEQMIWMTARMIEVARHADPKARLHLMIDQPWGSYLAREDRCYSPFTFVDTIVRMNLNLAAVELEVAVGYGPGGSYNRTLLDFSQLLDYYHELGLPLRVRLYCPSAVVTNGPVTTSAGYWRQQPNELTQAEWAERFILVALAKPFVELITWGQYHDGASAGQWPSAGVVDEKGKPKPLLDRLRSVRTQFRP